MLHSTLSIPILYVSHDLAEVERLADHLVLIEVGRRHSVRALEELQADPALPVARLPDAAVALIATVTEYDPEYGLTTLSIDGGTLIAPGHYGAPGTPQRVRIGASDVSLIRENPGPSTILNVLPARVAAAEPQDAAQMNVVVRLGGSVRVRACWRGSPGSPGGARRRARRSRPRAGQERRARGCK